MEENAENIAVWQREMESVHTLLTKIYMQPHNLHGEKWRYGMIKHYWKRRSELLATYPKGAKIPTLPIMPGVITFLDKMERIDPA